VSSKPPRIAIALCLKDEEHTLPTLLGSLHVSEGGKSLVFDAVVAMVDSRTSDRTREVLDSYGVIHEDFEWCEDFSAMRNASWSLAKKQNIDWIGWFDGDDKVVNIKKIIPVLIHAPERSWCISAEYKYSYDPETRRWLTTHTKERFMRADKPFVWINRVHECIHLPDMTVEEASAHKAITPEFWVEHQRKLDSSTFERNIRLLHLMNQDRANVGEPPDARVLHYVAQEYYHARQFELAAQWWTEYLKISGWPTECYHALLQQSHCFLELGRLAKARGTKPGSWYSHAINACMQAMSIRDDWCDAYYRIAMVKRYMGEFESCIQWTAMGKQLDQGDMGRIDKSQAQNQLDYDYHPAMHVTAAYFALQQPGNALDICEQVLHDYPNDKTFTDYRTQAVDWLEREQLAKAALILGEKCSEDFRADAWSHLPDEIRGAATVRDMYVTPLYQRTRGDDSRIVILCGEALEPWGPNSIDTEGIGGSETAVIQMATRLADRGYHVDLYNFAIENEGVYGSNFGVWDLARYNPEEAARLTIASRMPEFDKPGGTEKWWVWCHDLHYQSKFSVERAQEFDRIMPVSQFHSDYLARIYPFLNDHPGFIATRNGIDLSRFSTEDRPERQRRKCVFSSSPDRGLEELLLMWPEIHRGFEDAELHIFYGFQNWDKLIDSGARQLANRKQRLIDLFEGLKGQGVTWHGRVSQEELAHEYMTADIWSYPTPFVETSCITAMEAAVAGAVPVTSKLGALPETIGDRGLLIPVGSPRNRNYQQMFLGAISQCMTDAEDVEKKIAEWEFTGVVEIDEQARKMHEELKAATVEGGAVEQYRQRGFDYADRFSWDGVVDEWLRHLEAA
jgi:glycosyltransferase involved in cell wall biosynthesis